MGPHWPVLHIFGATGGLPQDPSGHHRHPHQPTPRRHRSPAVRRARQRAARRAVRAERRREAWAALADLEPALFHGLDGPPSGDLRVRRGDWSADGQELLVYVEHRPARGRGRGGAAGPQARLLWLDRAPGARRAVDRPKLRAELRRAGQALGHRCRHGGAGSRSSSTDHASSEQPSSDDRVRSRRAPGARTSPSTRVNSGALPQPGAAYARAPVLAYFCVLGS